MTPTHATCKYTYKCQGNQDMQPCRNANIDEPGLHQPFIQLFVSDCHNLLGSDTVGLKFASSLHPRQANSRWPRSPGMVAPKLLTFC